MKIVDKSVDEMLFENLALGDVFKFNSNIFMKVSNLHDGEPNAYDLTKNRLTDITENAIVRYVPSELILHGNDWNDLLPS